MKIAIGKPNDIGGSLGGGNGWIWFDTEMLSPHEIRQKLFEINAWEKDSGEEISLITMNRTVLDLVRFEDSFLGYEDVFVWGNGKLVPLLELHDEAWLCHFSLGDLYDRLELDVPAENQS